MKQLMFSQPVQQLRELRMRLIEGTTSSTAVAKPYGQLQLCAATGQLAAVHDQYTGRMSCKLMLYRQDVRQAEVPSSGRLLL